MTPDRTDAREPPAFRPGRRAPADAAYEPSDHAVDIRRVLAAWLLVAALGALAVGAPLRGAGGLVEAGPGLFANAADPDAALRESTPRAPTSWSRE